MTKDGERTFIKITNKDIYEKLEKIDRKLDYTNGKVRMHTKLFIALGTILLSISGWLFLHING